MTRGVAVFLVCMVAFAAFVDGAEAQPAVGVFGAIAVAAGQGADALGKFADSLDKFTRVAMKIHDTLATRRDKKRLKDLSKRFVWLEVEKRDIYDSIQQYLEQRSSPTWSDIASRIPRATEEVVRLIEDLKKEGSDFVVEVPDAYRDLIYGLGVKQRILERLRTSASPTSSGEMKELKQLAVALDKEIRSIERASDALAKYVAIRYSRVQG